jgi:predicted RNA-binding protein with PIN domain
MHLDSGLDRREAADAPLEPRVFTRNLNIDDKELEAIMEREFGAIKRPQYRSAKQEMQLERMTAPPRKEYVIVDGYNMIFAWDDLKALAETDLDAARLALIDLLAQYRAFKGCELVLVFDAYRVKGGTGSRFDRHDVHVVFTKENESGDLYIEKLANSIGRNYRVKVATSDALIQLSALRSGILRISAREFGLEVRGVMEQIGAVIEKTLPKDKKELGR